MVFSYKLNYAVTDHQKLKIYLKDTCNSQSRQAVWGQTLWAPPQLVGHRLEWGWRNWPHSEGVYWRNWALGRWLLFDDLWFAVTSFEGHCRTWQLTDHLDLSVWLLSSPLACILKKDIDNQLAIAHHTHTRTCFSWAPSAASPTIVVCLPQGLQNLPALLSSLIGNRKCNYHLIIIRNEFLKSIPSSRGAESRNSKGLAGLAETEHVTDEGTPHARTHTHTWLLYTMVTNYTWRVVFFVRWFFLQDIFTCFFFNLEFCFFCM